MKLYSDIYYKVDYLFAEGENKCEYKIENKIENKKILSLEFLFSFSQIMQSFMDIFRFFHGRIIIIFSYFYEIYMSQNTINELSTRFSKIILHGLRISNFCQKIRSVYAIPESKTFTKNIAKMKNSGKVRLVQKKPKEKNKIKKCLKNENKAKRKMRSRCFQLNKILSMVIFTNYLGSTNGFFVQFGGQNKLSVRISNRLYSTHELSNTLKNTNILTRFDYEYEDKDEGGKMMNISSEKQLKISPNKHNIDIIKDDYGNDRNNNDDINRDSNSNKKENNSHNTISDTNHNADNYHNIDNYQNSDAINNDNYNNHDKNNIDNSHHDNNDINNGNNQYNNNIDHNNNNFNNNNFHPIISQSPLVSFHTAGNWKDKKKSWGKYKKNTGWRDPYRDGEDSGIGYGGTFFWRFFAELFSDSRGYGERGERGSDRRERGSLNAVRGGVNNFENNDNNIKGKERKDAKNKLENEESNEEFLSSNIIENTIEIEKEKKERKKFFLDYDDDEVQEGVIGCIQSNCGTFFIRNVECSFDFTEDEDEDDNGNNNKDDDNHENDENGRRKDGEKGKKKNKSSDYLIERELLKSIRNYANPSRPKF